MLRAAETIFKINDRIGFRLEQKENGLNEVRVFKNGVRITEDAHRMSNSRRIRESVSGCFVLFDRRKS